MWKRVASLIVVIVVLASSTAIGQSVYGDRFIYNAGPRAVVGSGSPESVVVAAIGSTYARTDTGEQYLKISGAGNTGWLIVYRAGGVDIPVVDGGTGASTFTVNGVLYGNGTSPLLATTQGPASSVLAANAGAPAFTATPTVTSLSTTTVTSPAATNLTLSPTGDLITAPVGLDVLPGVNYTTNLGALTNKYLTLHAAELWVETLVAQNTIATIGGRVLVAPTNVLTIDQATGSTAFTFKYNNFAVGDRFYMEASGKVEFFAVTAGPTGTAGAYGYTVTRNLDGSGANLWYAGDAALNTGTTGSGFIDLYSVGGVLAGSGPAIVGNVRTGTTYNQIEPRWAIGNLNGLYGYSATIYGAAFGEPTGANLTLEPTNGFRVRAGTTTYAQLTGTTFTIGAPAGNRLAWDGTTLTLVSATVQMGATGIFVAPSSASPTGAWLSANGYSFGPPADGGAVGLYSYETPGGQRGVEVASEILEAVTTRDASLRLFARKGAAGSGNVATLELRADGDGVTTPLMQVNARSVFVGDMRVTGAVRFDDTPGTDRFSVVDGNVTIKTVIGVSTLTVTSATGALATSGLISSTGIGAHTFDVTTNGYNGVHIGNASTGTGAASYLQFGTNGSGTAASLVATSTTFTPSGPRIANAISLESALAGGLSISASAGDIRFYTGGTTERQRLDSNGDLRPITDGTLHVGVPSARYAYVTALAFNTTDIAMDNGWSFTEAERIGIAEPGVALVDDSGELIAFFGKSGFRARGLPGQGDIDDLPYHVTTLDDRVHMDRTPDVRVKGYAADGTPIRRTRADVPAMPDPKTARTKKNRAKP